MKTKYKTCKNCGGAIESHNLLESVFWVHCDSFSDLCADPPKAEPMNSKRCDDE